MKNSISTNIFEKIRKTYQNLKAYILTLTACFFVTMCYFVYKYYTTVKQTQPQTLIALRGTFISLYSGIYIFFNYEKITRFDSSKIFSLIGRASVNGFGMLFMVQALKYTRVSTCELFLRAGNVMSVFLGSFMLNEKVSKYDCYGLISTSLGVVLILKPTFIFGESEVGKEDQMIGIIFSVLCSFLVAIGIVMTKRLIESFDEIYAVLFMGMFGCFAGLLFSQINEVDISTIKIYDLLLLAFTVFFEFLGIWMNFIALHYETVAKISPFYNSRMIYAVIFVYLSTGLIDIFDIFGVGLMVGTYIYISIEKLKNGANQKISQLMEQSVDPMMQIDNKSLDHSILGDEEEINLHYTSKNQGRIYNTNL